MLYLEYESLKNKYLDAQNTYNAILDEKERLFAKTQPKGMRFDKESISGSGKPYTIDDYLIEIEQKGLNKRLEQAWAILFERKSQLFEKEHELKKSKALHDQIYKLRYLELLRPYKIASKVGYSESQVYRIIKIIDDNLQDARKCEKS